MQLLLGWDLRGHGEEPGSFPVSSALPSPFGNRYKSASLAYLASADVLKESLSFAVSP